MALTLSAGFGLGDTAAAEAVARLGEI